MPINFNNVDNIYHGTTPIKKVYRGSVVEWPEVITDNFRIQNQYAGTNTCTLTKNGNAENINLEYSFDNSNWSVWTADSSGIRTMSIPQNGSLYLRGENPNGFDVNNTDADYYNFTCSNEYAVVGNITSLISHYNTNYIPSSAFRKLFINSTTLVSASGLLLPALKPERWAYLHF